jgi:tRNA A-37 threonylcarbamoyl transferase component Bud32
MPALGSLQPDPRLSPAGFGDDIDALLRARLRLLSGLLAILGLALLVVGRAAAAAALGSQEFFTVQARDHVVVSALLLVAATHFWLRREALRASHLAAVDAAVFLVASGTLVAVYVIEYEGGPWRVIPLLLLFMLARAVLIPSTARRTLVVSSPAVLGIAACQLAHGTSYLATNLYYSEEAFRWAFVWDQAILWAGVGVAMLISLIHHRLRLETFKARRLGQYVVETRIARGAMGELYRATHALLKRPTAIKVVRPEIVSEETLRRFEHEVRQTCRLAHPNSVLIYDYGHTATGVFYYAMELLQGLNLEQVVEKAGPLPAGRVIHILAQACAALEEAHALGLIHRDIKPRNLMLCVHGGEYDFVKVLDFGLVKDLRSLDPSGTVAGTVCGSPETIAPEAIRGEAIGPAADLYALGAVACFLLTGAGVFNASTAAEYFYHHLHTEPIPPSELVRTVPADLEALLLECLRKDPSLRPGSARALRERLLGCRDARSWTREDATRWWQEIGATFTACADQRPATRAADLESRRPAP